MFENTIKNSVSEKRNWFYSKEKIVSTKNGRRALGHLWGVNVLVSCLWAISNDVRVSQ